MTEIETDLPHLSDRTGMRDMTGESLIQVTDLTETGVTEVTDTEIMVVGDVEEVEEVEVEEEGDGAGTEEVEETEVLHARKIGIVEDVELQTLEGERNVSNVERRRGGRRRKFQVQRRNIMTSLRCKCGSLRTRSPPYNMSLIIWWRLLLKLNTWKHLPAQTTQPQLHILTLIKVERKKTTATMIRSQAMFITWMTMRILQHKQRKVFLRMLLSMILIPQILQITILLKTSMMMYRKQSQICL